jgi:hypothetical protein
VFPSKPAEARVAPFCSNPQNSGKTLVMRNIRQKQVDLTVGAGVLMANSSARMCNLLVILLTNAAFSIAKTQNAP